MKNSFCCDIKCTSTSISCINPVNNSLSVSILIVIHLTVCVTERIPKLTNSEVGFSYFHVVLDITAPKSPDKIKPPTIIPNFFSACWQYRQKLAYRRANISKKVFIKQEKQQTLTRIVLQASNLTFKARVPHEMHHISRAFCSHFSLFYLRANNRNLKHLNHLTASWDIQLVDILISKVYIITTGKDPPSSSNQVYYNFLPFGNVGWVTQ